MVESVILTYYKVVLVITNFHSHNIQVHVASITILNSIQYSYVANITILNSIQ